MPISLSKVKVSFNVSWLSFVFFREGNVNRKVVGIESCGGVPVKDRSNMC